MNRTYADFRRLPSLIGLTVLAVSLLYHSVSLALEYWGVQQVHAPGGVPLLILLSVLTFSMPQLYRGDRRPADVLVLRNFREVCTSSERFHISSRDRTLDFILFHLLPTLKCFGKVVSLSNPHAYTGKGAERLFNLFLSPKHLGVRVQGDWKSVVDHFLVTAKVAVFVITDPSDNVLWEINQALYWPGKRRVVLLMSNGIDFDTGPADDNVMRIVLDMDRMQDTIPTIIAAALESVGPVNRIYRRCLRMILQGRSPLSQSYQWLSIVAEHIPRHFNTVERMDGVRLVVRNCQKCAAPAHYTCQSCRSHWCYDCQERNGLNLLSGVCGACGGKAHKW